MSPFSSDEVKNKLFKIGWIKDYFSVASDSVECRIFLNNLKLMELDLTEKLGISPKDILFLRKKAIKHVSGTMNAEFYNVDQGDEIIVHWPDKATTSGAGPCMILGILNRKTRKGYLGHYNMWDKTSETLVDKAVSESEHAKDLEVALAGNVPESRDSLKEAGEDYDEFMKNNTAHAEWSLNMVKSKGIIKIQNFLQNNINGECYDMIVDTEKGKIKVEKDDDNT